MTELLELGTFMLKVSCLKFFASESKEFAFWAELVAPDLPSASYLSHVVCELLHKNESLPCARLNNKARGFLVIKKKIIEFGQPSTSTAMTNYIPKG